jgi:FAD:protein FMN transferase
LASLSYQVETWGTVILIELSSQVVGEEKLRVAADEAQEFLLKIDRLFSTYRSDSQVSEIRAGQLDIAGADPLVKEVWDSCLLARELTDGAFDPMEGRWWF